MKKICRSVFSLIVLFLFVVLALPCMAADTAADAVIAQNNTALLVNGLVVALIPIIASLLANLTTKKDSDNPWTRLGKNILNLLALNFSEKAGK